MFETAGKTIMKKETENDNLDDKMKESIGHAASYLKYLHLGLVFTIVIGLFLGLGYLLDVLFGTYPWLFAISVFPGFAAAFYLLYKELIKPEKN